MLLFAERAIFLFYQFHTLILLFAERAIFWLGLYGGEKLRNHLEWGDYVTSLHHSGPILIYLPKDLTKVGHNVS